MSRNRSTEDTSSFRRQGSIRKVLPTVPNAVSNSAKMIDKRNNESANQYAPYFLEYSLIAEYNMLADKNIPGIYVVPAYKTPLVWFGVLFVRQGFYMTGIFKFTLHIPEKYPDGDTPKIIFDPAVYHPLIHPTTGELDLHRSFPKWRRNVHHLWQLILFARKVFYKIDVTNPVNEDAAELFEKDLDEFKIKVHLSIVKSKEKVYENPDTDDPHALRFSPLESSQYEETKKKMLSRDSEASQVNNKSEKGLSWIDPDSLEIFTRDQPSAS